MSLPATDHTNIFSCPMCGTPLKRLDKSWLCDKHHTFDVASEGYVHLLPVQNKNSLSPGDDREMVSARREFLNSGAYMVFSDALNSITHDLLNDNLNATVLDAGCGEGYYTDRLYSDARKQGLQWTVAGIDISKAAVKYAAKRNAAIQWAVASLFQIPMQGGSADGIVNLFAPIVPAEFRRVLRPGGYLVIAVPGENHLLGLKEILYKNVYQNERIDTEYPGFRYINRVDVRSDLELTDPLMIQALLTMTPYYWKTPAAGIEKLKQTSFLKTEIEFDFLIYQAQ